MPGFLAKLDRFTIGLIVSVGAGILVPCSGVWDTVFSGLSDAAIVLLFFLYGAKLSRRSVWEGLMHWRLQGLVAASTFVIFPLLGMFSMPLWNSVLGPDLCMGMLYVCMLPSTVQSSIAFTSMAGGNVAHCGEQFGDEDDMLFITMEYPGRRYAVLEYGSAFRWQEHYLLIQGTRGAIKIDMCSCGMTLKTGQKEEHFLVHRTKEEDDDRTRIYRETERDNGNQFGRPGRKPFLWLQGIMDEEMEFLNAVLHGAKVTEEFLPLLTGEAARNSIATADACTLSLNEDRKVRLSEIIEQ